MCTKSEHVKGRDHLEDLGIDWSIMLKHLKVIGWAGVN
jgi:hypothetical protein